MEAPRVAEFERVSYEQFVKDAKKCGFEFYASDTDEEDIYRKAYNAIEIPTRHTSGSAGYDISSPFPLTLNLHESRVIPTGLRCQIMEGHVLVIFVRSSIGIKREVVLTNGTAVIDSDYYYADNEGHIMLALKNLNSYYQTIKRGERVAQGVFVPFGITASDEAVGLRSGGIGSTGV